MDTDEEMAEEYCDNEVPFDATESGEKLYTENDLKYAYLAGLKAGRIAMFEKEAEEWEKNNCYPFSDCPNIEKSLKDAYQKGAEFGYNKAKNE